MALDIAGIQARTRDPLMQAFGNAAMISQFRNQRQQGAAQAAQQQRQAAIDEELAQLAAKPNKTFEDFQSVMIRNPDLAAPLDKVFGAMDTAKKEQTIQQIQPVFAALETGNVEIAKGILEDQLAAAEGAGDERMSRALRGKLKELEIDPEAVKLSTGISLSRLMGDDFKGILDTLESRRESGVFEDARLRKALADANLTEAQAKKTLADTEALGVDTKLALIELEGAKQGGFDLDPEKIIDTEKKLRDEFNKGITDSIKVQEAFRRFDVSEDSAQGDMSMIFQFMRMLDPGSTVREGEFALAGQTTGVPGRITNLYNQAIRGERLNEDQRGGFRSQAEKLLKASKTRINDVKADLLIPVENYGLNPENVFGTRMQEEVNSGDAALEQRFAELTGQGMTPQEAANTLRQEGF